MIRRNRQVLKPKEQSASSIASKVPPEAAKDQFVAAPPDQKEDSSNLPDPAPHTSTDPVPVASSDPVPDIPTDHVPATPVKCTRTRVVKPPKRFEDFDN